MDTATANAVEEALASTLIHLAADYAEAQRPIDVKTTRAALDGACRAAHAVGYGLTPADVSLSTLDWVRANPRPAAGGAFPAKFKAWAATGRAEVGAWLAGAGPNAVRGTGAQCPACGGWGLAGCACPAV